MALLLAMLIAAIALTVLIIFVLVYTTVRKMSNLRPAPLRQGFDFEPGTKVLAVVEWQYSAGTRIELMPAVIGDDCSVSVEQTRRVPHKVIGVCDLTYFPDMWERFS